MSAARSRAMVLRDGFAAQGAVIVEPPVLQSAELLLDLYGEDIRSRAYVTSDALRGEQMLRPDFTVPVVQMHMAQGAEPARYTYAGTVFRRQEDHADRANEYLQTGYEIFDRADPASADAEVFALMSNAVAHLNLRAATGDIGILTAAVDGLQTTERRKAALRRHIWRPRRFRALLDRFAGRVAIPQSRAALLVGSATVDAPLTGLRSAAEIEERINALRTDAASPPISASEMDGLEALLTMRVTLPKAVEQLHELTSQLPSISSAVARLETRIEALERRDIDVERLVFEASFGRTSMEYYDGFVFGFYAEARPDLPAVASGGRYDALTRRLGQGREIPAVGGVLRPGLLVELERDA
jgi:ATP phosphoribosyltransferase regulatory subunit